MYLVGHRLCHRVGMKRSRCADQHSRNHDSESQSLKDKTPVARPAARSAWAKCLLELVKAPRECVQKVMDQFYPLTELNDESWTKRRRRRKTSREELVKELESKLSQPANETIASLMAMIKKAKTQRIDDRSYAAKRGAETRLQNNARNERMRGVFLQIAPLAPGAVRIDDNSSRAPMLLPVNRQLFEHCDKWRASFASPIEVVGTLRQWYYEEGKTMETERKSQRKISIQSVECVGNRMSLKASILQPPLCVTKEDPKCIAQVASIPLTLLFDTSCVREDAHFSATVYIPDRVVQRDHFDIHAPLLIIIASLATRRDPVYFPLSVQKILLDWLSAT